MIAWGLVDMFWALIYVVSVFGIMFILNARLALIIIMIVPCIALLTVYFQNRILKWNRKVRRINSQITSAYNEGITGVKTSKSMVIEKDNEKRFVEKTSDMRHASIRSAKLNAVYIPVSYTHLDVYKRQVNELLSLSQRFEVAKMLRDHKTYLEIAEKTGASTATISRVNRSLNYGNDGYDMVFERMEEE